MDSLEARIQYHFKKADLLEEALTHPSLSIESKEVTKPHNQRLEFLGDSVLQLVLTEFLFFHYPAQPEGFLTKLRTRLVQENALARVARSIQLGAQLRLGRGEILHGGHNRDSTLADAMEALLGAIYLDAGLETVRSLILHLWEAELQSVKEAPVELNPKGMLQELLQGCGKPAPSYQIVSSDGPDHAKTFEAVVTLHGQILGRGTGATKKLAQSLAATQALDSDFVKTLSV